MGESVAEPGLASSRGADLSARPPSPLSTKMKKWDRYLDEVASDDVGGDRLDLMSLSDAQHVLRESKNIDGELKKK